MDTLYPAAVTLAGPDSAFVKRLAKLAGLDDDYVLGTLTRDGCIDGDRIVSLRLTSYEGESLDVSTLDALGSLYVTGKQLTRVTLGALPKLASVTIRDVKLEPIDLSGCPNITTLDLARCQLATLPDLPPRLEELLVPDNPLGRVELRSKTLRRLDVTRCRLDALDVSKLPGLARLDVAFNALRKLDLRALDELAILWCQGNGAEVGLPPSAPLTTLVISGNPRAELDASAYPRLTTLFADDAGLRTLTLGNPVLGHLQCANNGLAQLDLAASPAIRRLEARGNAFRSLDLRPLAKLEALEIDGAVDVLCTDLQKHVLPALRARFGLPKPTKTIAKMDLYQLHAFVGAYNWDSGPKKLLEVIRQPACTLATALLTYWQSEPAELSQYAKPKDAPKSDRGWVELLREIEAGVAAKRFPRGPLTFDLRDVHGSDLSDPDPKIPTWMRDP